MRDHNKRMVIAAVALSMVFGVLIFALMGAMSVSSARPMVANRAPFQLVQDAATAVPQDQQAQQQQQATAQPQQQQAPPPRVESDGVIENAVPVIPGDLDRISWGAVIGGSIIAMMIQLALNLLGLSIGVTSLNPKAQDDGQPDTGAFAKTAAVWVGFSTLLALLAGGWVAARFAGIPETLDGILHGLMVWGVVTLISVFLLTSTIGRFMSGISTMISHALTIAERAAEATARGAASLAQTVVHGAATAASDAAHTIQHAASGAANNAQGGMSSLMQTIEHELDKHPEVSNALQLQNLSMESIQHEAQMLLRQAGLSPERLQTVASDAVGDIQQSAQQARHQDPEHAVQTMQLALRRAFLRAQNATDNVDRQSVVNLLMERGNMSEEQANETMTRWEGEINRARQQTEMARQQAMDKIEQVRMDAERKANELQAEVQRKADQARRDAEHAAREAAAQATSAISKLAAAVFAAILIGAIAAGAGGALGTPDELPRADIDLNETSSVPNSVVDSGLSY